MSPKEELRRMIDELRAKKEAEKKAKNPNRVGGWYVELKRQREARGEHGMWNEYPFLLIFQCVVAVTPTDFPTLPAACSRQRMAALFRRCVERRPEKYARAQASGPRRW